MECTIWSFKNTSGLPQLASLSPTGPFKHPTLLRLDKHQANPPNYEKLTTQRERDLPSRSICGIASVTMEFIASKAILPSSPLQLAPPSVPLPREHEGEARYH